MPAHWHVLGAGAMGCLFASALHRVGCTASLVLRGPASEDHTRLRVERDGASQDIQLPVSASSDSTAITHLLVTTKAYDVCQAVTALAHRLSGESRVLLLVNGMGFTQELQRDLPWLDLYHGTTTEGAYRMAPRHINHAGHGQTRLGQQGRRQPPDWFEAWSEALQDCLWDSDIAQALWLKLAINCAINPLTALHGCRNGELAQRPALATEVNLLCREIALVSTAAGYADVAAELEQAVGRVIAATASNRSSMLQDVQQGQRTEIDYITGHLLAVARRHGVAAPHSAALLEQVHKLER